MPNTASRRPDEPLRVIQINVGRGAVSHEAALSLGAEDSADIILVQEPYILSTNLPRRITKRHPQYDAFTPTDDWSAAKPRVVSYVRKDAGLRCQQRFLPGSLELAARDILALEISSPSGRSVTVINVYNAPPGSDGAGEAARLLGGLSPGALPRRTLLAGDFNLHHEWWQPSFSGRPSPGAEPFVDWLSTHQYQLVSEPDTSTHDRGNVLDLVLASGPLAQLGTKATIAEHLEVGSDHVALVCTIPWDQRHGDSLRPLLLKTLDSELFTSTLSVHLASVVSLPGSPTSEHLDDFASSLTTALQRAYAAAAKRGLPRRTGTPWWNQDCRTAAAYLSALQFDPQSADEDLAEAKKEFRRTVSRAKASYWREKIEAAKTSKDVFDMAKWYKSTGSYRTPPLRDPLNPDEPPASTIEQKRGILIRNLLRNMAEAGDIPMDAPTVACRALPFPALTPECVFEAVCKAGNTAPGADGIPTAILRAAWSLIKDHVLSLYTACLSVGHHPKCFRSATLAMLQKPNKADRTSPRSYRPIALLSVLGKGLERLVARRLSWLVIRHAVLAPQQFGALPLRSSVDLTTCLTHDVETALNQGFCCSLLTLDVKGAFDAILPGRLVHRLRSQGWPEHIVRWVGSFATDRSVRIRLDGETGPDTPIQCGLPQGSPVSPILFMLFLAPLFRLGKPKARFGYADDVALLAIGRDLEANCGLLSKWVQEALDWGLNEAITFDPGKSELLHFSRLRNPSSPSVVTPSLSVSEAPDKPWLRWLGVLFDRKLSFKWHAQDRAASALTVANALRSLGNTVRGPSAELLRSVAIACVHNKALFAAETWFPGTTRPGARPDSRISNGIGHLIQKLDRVFAASARAVLPVYKTTPTSALMREAGFLPPELALDHRVRQATSRIHRLDARHPLKRRAAVIRERGTPTSRLARNILSHPECEPHDPMVLPPWFTQEPAENARARIDAPSGRPTEFLRFLRGLPSSDLVVYTDASKLPTGPAGGGIVITKGPHVVWESSFALNPGLDAHTAEAQTVLRSLRAATTLPATTDTANIWICTDCMEVARLLLTQHSEPPQQTYEAIRSISTSWALRPSPPDTPPRAVRVRWLKGHAGIPSNVRADLLARQGAMEPWNRPIIASISSLPARNRAITEKALNAYWDSEAPASYKLLHIPVTPLKQEMLSLPRKLLGHIIASRTAHGDFADYHERFNHEDYHANCLCGRRKTALHFFFCRIARHRSPRPPGRPRDLIPSLLGTEKGTRTLAEWLKTSGFYDTICTRRPPPE